LKLLEHKGYRKPAIQGSAGQQVSSNMETITLIKA